MSNIHKRTAAADIRINWISHVFNLIRIFMEISPGGKANTVQDINCEGPFTTTQSTCVYLWI